MGRCQSTLGASEVRNARRRHPILRERGGPRAYSLGHVGKRAPRRGSLLYLLHQLFHRGGDAVFHFAGPAEGGAAVFIEAPATLVAALEPDSSRGDVGNHVVGVAADPGAWAVLPFE